MVTNNKEIKAFHGSGVAIQSFDYQFTDQGNDQLGSGFYFTTAEHEARGYCLDRLNGKPKLGGCNDPTLHHVVLNIKNPITPGTQRLFTRAEVMDIIKSSPVLEEQIENNWGEIAFEGLTKLTMEAVDSYDYGEPTDVIRFLNSISKDFYPSHPQAFFELIHQITGHDGVHAQFKNKDAFVNHEHYVAWFPSQINIIHRHSLVDELCEIVVAEDPEIVDGMPLFHGGEQSDIDSIINDGLDIDKSSIGYFGKGFYCATDAQLAISNYANFADNPAAVALTLKPGANILDLRKETDFKVYQAHIEKVMHLEDLPERMRVLKIDGIYDRSFGGLVIYNARAVQVVGALKLQPRQVSRKNNI